MLFFGVFFLRFLWFCGWFFCVFGKVAKVLKMLVFPIFGASVRWLILVYLGLEGLGVFVVLMCFSLVQVLLLFVLALFLFCCWIVVGVVLVFCFFLFFCAFVLLFSCFCVFWRV